MQQLRSETWVPNPPVAWRQKQRAVAMSESILRFHPSLHAPSPPPPAPFNFMTSDIHSAPSRTPATPLSGLFLDLGQWERHDNAHTLVLHVENKLFYRLKHSSLITDESTAVQEGLNEYNKLCLLFLDFFFFLFLFCSLFLSSLSHAFRWGRAALGLSGNR